MLSPETLETYRRMTPSDRLRLTIDLMQDMHRSLLSGTAEQVERKFQLIRRENDLRNQNMLQAMAKTKCS